MSRHLLKLKLVSFIFVFIYPIFLYLECAALVKEGKVYGVGTEDMDVCTIFVFSTFIFQSYF